jgi:integrase/recombinase XerD
MTTSSALQSHPASSDSRLLTAAVAAYLGRRRGQSRIHTDSDIKVFLRWSATQALDPLQAARIDIERYVRWLQDVRLDQPSTVSRRLAVVIGFYRVCVIDEILPHSPADYVGRPLVPPESPTLGLSHLQFEAMITAARLLANINDFALVAMLGLLGLRIFEACGAISPTSARNTATAYLRSAAKEARSSWCRYFRRWLGRSTAPSMSVTMARSCETRAAPVS